MSVTFHVDTGAARVSARHYVPARDALGAVLVFAHGAGAGQLHPFMVAVGDGLAERGIDVVTFNFPYMEAGKRVPDRTPVLEACFTAVMQSVRQRVERAAAFIGGKSMGGRMATHLAATKTLAIAGVVCYGYPLHPPGRPEQLRIAHLPAIDTPVLVVQGSRDDFGAPAEIRRHFAAVRGAFELVDVAGGDHSFTVRKDSGRTRTEVMASVFEATAAWIRARCADHA